MRRVKVDGTCDAAKALRTLIARDTVLVMGRDVADMTIRIADGDVPCPQIDGIDSEFERLALAHIGQLSPSGQVLVLFKAGVVAREDELAITVPIGSEAEALAVEQGVYRALLQAARPAIPAEPRPWWRRR